MADSEKENGIFIEDIKLLQKQIFEYFDKKGIYNINYTIFLDLDSRDTLKDREKKISINNNEENIKITNEYENDDNYFNSIIFDQESLDYPFSRKDLQENFFYYSNKVKIF